MMKLPPLGNLKPSVMLVEMLECCPAGESTTALFAYLFLQRLLRESCVLLSKEDLADTQAIADKADWLISLHILQGHNVCTADEDFDASKLEAGYARGKAEEVQASGR
jgi:hypothetical protein